MRLIRFSQAETFGSSSCSSRELRATLHSVGRVSLAIAAGLLVANCSSSPGRMAGKGGIDPKYGVSPSPRVVADGEPVPKGGGRELVGKPYVVAGRLYTPREAPNYSAVGTASWYGAAFHGRRTANGEVFDRMSISAAHPTLPIPSYIRVTNTQNGYSMIARVNDRGPYHGNRLIDVSQRVAEALRFKHIGTARVRVDYVGRASINGSSDEKLYATLRTDGYPATLGASSTVVARADQILPQRQALGSPQAIDDDEVEPVAPARPTPVSASAPAAAPVPVRAPVVAAMPVGKPAPGIPLPPDRPFDLGTIPNAAKPVAPRTVHRVGGNVTAGLFYADSDAEASTFRKNDPMARLIEQNFLPLRGSAKF